MIFIRAIKDIKQHKIDLILILRTSQEKRSRRSAQQQAGSWCW